MSERYSRSFPRDLYRAEDVRAMDRYAIETVGIPGIELMRRAGASAFAALRQRWPEARTLSAICGSGNNGEMPMWSPAWPTTQAWMCGSIRLRRQRI